LEFAIKAKDNTQICLKKNGVS